MTGRNLAVRALVMLAAVAAAAAATIQPQASTAKLSVPVSASTRPARPPDSMAGVPCHVITGNALGVCPAVLSVSVDTGPAVVVCPKLAHPAYQGRMDPPPALCGSGFHPNDHIAVIVIGAYGSTFWPAEANAGGRFRSVLPSPLCRLTPATVFAFDMHERSSPSISLRGPRCP